MTDSKMSGLFVHYGKRLLTAAVASLSVGAAMASEPPVLDWQNAIAGFTEGEQRSPMVFNMKEAARCTGRWKLHADAVDDGAFPEMVIDAFIEQLRYAEAVSAVDFFLTEDPDHPAHRDAANEAERLLTLALAGDAVAARTYFDNLGLCSTLPEMVKDAPGVATDAAATTQKQAEAWPIELSSGDFDEPINQQRLSFVELFAQRLRDGAPVADLLKPQISFVYLAESECAAVTTAHVDQLPAAEVDAGFSFWATYTWENPDCAVPPEIESLEDFTLNATMSHWSRIEAAAEDHNFEIFYFKDEKREDYLVIRIEPHGGTFAVSQIEYRLAMF